MASAAPDNSNSARERQLFELACGVPPDRREPFVRARAGDDVELADQVLELLRQAGAAATEHGAEVESSAAAAVAGGKLEQIGPFRILETLGEGGMGMVYLAEQREPVHRRVALKVLKPGMDSKAFLARFDAERQALAMMEHSCIARVYEAGLASSGHPYLAMEYVKGLPITQYCDERNLSIAQRLELFTAVCSAVQHAHTKGVMHRDLKPSNILVTEQDGRPEPKVIDFGLAKASDDRLSEATMFTETGQVVGTPEYMSPEQAGGGGMDIDTRTDVFSLGVLLYELLTGTLPMTRQELLAGGYAEMQRIIREEEMPKPSTRVSTLAEGARLAKTRQLPTGGLQRQLRGELDWIVMKAIEKDRNRRYMTAQELAADVRRYLDGDPVTAGAPSATYLLGKLARRYRGALTTMAIVLVALGVGLAIAVWQWGVAVEQQQIAQDNAAKERLAKEDAARERDRANDLFARYRKLEDKVRLTQFEAGAVALWPEGPSAVEPMTAWLAQVEAWLETMADHRLALTELRTRGRQQEGAWVFEDASEQFLHDTLAGLVHDLEAFVAATGTLGRVRESLDWSRRVEAETLTRYADEWRAASRRVRAHPEFDGRVLPKQAGLVPLGTDPNSQLEEFWFARSGKMPTRGSDGRLQLAPDSGVVLVLLPGGKARIGSEPGPGVYRPETPAHEVELEPFFLGKFELTQGQWLRLTGGNPSTYQSPRSLWHPVESVSFYDAVAALRPIGLQLPTEAQWEYACRAGTATLWYFGDDRAALVRNGRGRFNAASGGVPDAALWPEYDDGFAVHISAGTFEANAFGLFDMHGNIAELTRGAAVLVGGRLANYDSVRHGAGDGVILGPETPRVVQRGGSFFRRVEDARSARRTPIRKDAKYDNVGLRVALPVRR